MNTIWYDIEIHTAILVYYIIVCRGKRTTVHLADDERHFNEVLNATNTDNHLFIENMNDNTIATLSIGHTANGRKSSLLSFRTRESRENMNNYSVGVIKDWARSTVLQP